MVALSSQVVGVLEPRTTKCWPLLETTILNPRWVRNYEAIDKLSRDLEDAVAQGADAASYNAIGWTCLAAALCCEPRAVSAMLPTQRVALQHNDDGRAAA